MDPPLSSRGDPVSVYSSRVPLAGAVVGVIFLHILVHIYGCFWAFREKPCYPVHLSSRIIVVHFLGLMFEIREETNEAIVNIASWQYPFVLL